MSKKCILFSLSIMLFFVSGITTDASERKANFDSSWKFHRGSIANAEQSTFNDNAWRTLDLPHDWSVEPAPIQYEGITVGPFSKLNESGAGGADTGQTLGGEGWYRKEYTLSEEDTSFPLLREILHTSVIRLIRKVERDN